MPSGDKSIRSTSSRTMRACSAGKSSSHNGAKSGDGSNHLALGRVAITPMQKVGASVAACPSTRLLGILAVLRFLVTLACAPPRVVRRLSRLIFTWPQGSRSEANPAAEAFRRDRDGFSCSGKRA
jgi:hypothetical protein